MQFVESSRSLPSSSCCFCPSGHAIEMAFLYFRHVGHTRLAASTDSHFRLQVVDHIADKCDQDEEDQNDEEDDDIPLHGGLCGYWAVCEGPCLWASGARGKAVREQQLGILRVALVVSLFLSGLSFWV